jgi:high affinity Mn2+ porin
MKFIFNIPIILLFVSTAALSQQMATLFPRLKNDRIWLSGQANVIFQTQPGVSAHYGRTNSFSQRHEKATSRVLTLYTGVQLSSSIAVLADVEQAGGQGLSNGYGLSAAPNADFIGADTFGLRPYLARLMLHKIFTFSTGRQETNRGPLSTFGTLPVRRLEWRAGKFSAADFFDTNTIGGDTHLQFMNSATMQNAAYDYAADASGYTWGTLAEYQQPSLGIRFAELLMPSTAGGMHLVGNLSQARSENFELELRHSVIGRKPAVLRILGFVNHGNMGRYRDAIEHADRDMTLHPQQTTAKFGVGLNVEQSIAHQVTAFARAGWNNGQTESFNYAEVDNTMAAGVGMNGQKWRRAFDRAGVAFATNGITSIHRAYLANGGCGMMLGAGGLTYGRETVVETYYTFYLKRGVYLSPAVQVVNNPGYNRDRGVAVIGSFRTHVEF